MKWDLNSEFGSFFHSRDRFPLKKEEGLKKGVRGNILSAPRHVLSFSLARLTSIWPISICRRLSNGATERNGRLTFRRRRQRSRRRESGRESSRQPMRNGFHFADVENLSTGNRKFPLHRLGLLNSGDHFFAEPDRRSKAK